MRSRREGPDLGFAETHSRLNADRESLTLARMKFAICNEIFKGWKIEDTFEYAAKIGFAGVEIAPFTLANSVADVSLSERDNLRAAAARAGIVIAGIHWVLVKPEGLYMNHPDAAIRERTANYFCELVDFCADLGGKVMVVGSPKQRNVIEGISYQQAWDWAASTFRDAVRLSSKSHSSPRTYINCIGDKPSGQPRSAQADGIADYHELQVAHDAMVAAPQEVAELLRSVAVPDPLRTSAAAVR